MADRVLYSITGWTKHFEKSQSRRVDNVQWVPLPVKHDGLGYRRVMAMKDGMEIYAAWVLIVQVAAKCEKRGVLANDHGKPLTAADIALKTGGKADAISKALQVLSSEDVGWLVAQTQHDTNAVDDVGHEDAPRVQDNTEQEKTGQNNTTQQVRMVFDHYRTYHPRAFPKPCSKSKEWQKIRERLAEGYTAEDLCAAIDGCHRSPFHCGVNRDNKKYQNLELIVRDGSRVNDFLNVPAEPGPVLSEKTQRTLRAAESWAMRGEDNGDHHEEA